MRHDLENGSITFSDTHAIIKRPRRRGSEVAEILGRVPGKDGGPELVYLRTRIHARDSEEFNEPGAGCWSATGAISTVLVAEPSGRRAPTPW